MISTVSSAIAAGVPKLLSGPAQAMRPGKLRFAGDGFSGQAANALDFSQRDLTGSAFESVRKAALLSGANFTDATLNGQDLDGKRCDGAVFNGVHFRDGRIAAGVLNQARFNRSERGRQADLTGTYMEGIRCDNTQFIYALMDRTVLSRAIGEGTLFRRASLKDGEISWAELPKADFEAADLSGADLRHSEFNERGFAVNLFTKAKQAREHAASFKLAKLHGADLMRCNLVGVDFSGAKLNGNTAYPTPANLYNTHLEFANFTEADLSGVLFEKSWLKHADFTRATLNGANFTTLESDDMLADVNFTEAALARANFEGMKLRGIDFRRAQMPGAHLNKAELNRLHLEGANLQGAGLAGAKLHGAHLNRAQLQGANLEDAELLGADLRDAQLDAATNLAGAKYNRQTKFPAGFEIPETMVYVPDLLDKLPGKRG